MSALQDQVAWITGGGTGIGLAGGIELARAGATVVLSGRRARTLEDGAARIRAAGGRVETVPLDVADRAAVAAAAASILDRFERVDILVNSAGTNVPTRPWADVDADGWDLVNAVNADGTFYCIRSEERRVGKE